MVFRCTALLIGLEENGVSDGPASLPKSSLFERPDRREEVLAGVRAKRVLLGCVSSRSKNEQIGLPLKPQ